MDSVDLWVAVPADAGWEPMRRMTALLAAYLDTNLRILPQNDGNRLRARIGELTYRNRRDGGQAVVVAANPGDLVSALGNGVSGRYRRVVGWVIDSFWSERIPHAARSGKVFDHVFVTDAQDVPEWLAAGVPSVSVLPWGTDAWGMHASERGSTRKLDLLRVGREAPPWEDEDRVARAGEDHGLTFHGRPPFGSSSAEGSEILHRYLSRSRSVLAFSNSVSQANYTHKHREYLTARWTDSLAHGCLVVGRRPRSTSADELLWPEATLDLDPTDVEAGMVVLADALRRWTPEDAERRSLRALAHLDWRLRFRTLFADLGLDSPALDRDLAAMAAHLKDHGLALENA